MTTQNYIVNKDGVSVSNPNAPVPHRVDWVTLIKSLEAIAKWAKRTGNDDLVHYFTETALIASTAALRAGYTGSEETQKGR